MLYVQRYSADLSLIVDREVNDAELPFLKGIEVLPLTEAEVQARGRLQGVVPLGLRLEAFGFSIIHLENACPLAVVISEISRTCPAGMLLVSLIIGALALS